tara:strand:+ start:372 stop:713 length:342 start_codon:yes stop_codon:yes gene_type:complete
MSLNKAAISEKETRWNEEKSHLQQQLDFTQQQFKENQKMHKQLMNALQQKSLNPQVQKPENSSETEAKCKELSDINKMLSETVSRQESKNHELNAKVDKMKVFSKCYKHSLSN